MEKKQVSADLRTILPDMAGLPALQILGLTRDSRHVKAGDAYLAIQGSRFDGHQFIDQAIAQGAVVVLCERETHIVDVPCVVVPDLAKHVGDIAARFYHSPSSDLKVVGVTGTNGKTSCTQFIARALQRLGQRCGVIGTLGTGYIGQLDEGRLTTPDAIGVQQSLASFRDENTQIVAMEVSSHGLDQRRVNGVAFDIAVYTNLSRDHLDYHNTMEEYGAAKKQLFLKPGLKYAVINADDEFGQKLLCDIKGPKKYAYGLKKPEIIDAELIYATKFSTNAKGLTATIVTPWGNGQFKSRLLGEFNLSNLLAVLTTLCLLDVSFEKALQSVAEVETVPGRMQTFGGGKLPTVVVDYSHTPDALMFALSALRSHCSGKIWCVFGCGGDRDRGKRKLMGEVAERFSDQLVITNDNPRSEDPQSIVDDIMTGLLCPWATEVELDRGTAIAHAIDCASAGDMVLIAGKGHEPYQLVGKDRIPFSDIEQVKQHISRKRQQRNEESSDDTVN